MKKSLALASLILVASSAVAAKVRDMMIGVEIGTSKTTHTTTTTAASLNRSYSSSDSINTIHESLKVGKYFDFGRVGTSITILNKKDDVSGYSLSVGYDYLLRNDNNKFIPFAGVSIGYSDNKYDDWYSYKQTGFNYGVQAGLLYEAMDNIDLEIGVRYMLSTANGDTTVVGTWSDGSVASTNIDTDIDNISQFYISVNYNF